MKKHFQVVITVIADDGQAVFDDPVYHVTITENQHPPSLVVDLTTKQETLGLVVDYFFISNPYQG